MYITLLYVIQGSLPGPGPFMDSCYRKWLLDRLPIAPVSYIFVHEARGPSKEMERGPKLDKGVRSEWEV